MTKEKLGVGVIGVGLIGTGRFGQFLLQAYSEMEDIEVNGICSTTEKKLKKLSKEYEIPYYTTDYKELIQREDLDIIVVATPPYLHAEMSIQSLKQNKHVLCEKPLAINMKEADKIRQALNKRNSKFKVDFVMRPNPIIKRLKEIIDKKLLGKPENVNFINYASDSHLSPDHWFWDKKKSGGIWVEHGVHFFDLFNYLLSQKPEEIRSMSITRENMEDRVSCLTTYKNVLATFTHSFTNPYQVESTSFTICFERGTIRVEGWIPLKMKIEGVVDKGEEKKLEKILGKEIDSKKVEDVKKKGKECKADRKVEIDFKTDKDKEELYKQAIKEVMENLVKAVKGEEELDFGFDEAYEALENAIEADKNKEKNLKSRK